MTQPSIGALEAQTTRRVRLENAQLVTQSETSVCRAARVRKMVIEPVCWDEAHAAFSRCWQLERTLATGLTLGALEQAIATRKPAPGLVHHSDRGVQYASQDYVAVLERHGMIPSMSRPANPYDNDYASHCTSWVRCDSTSLARRRCDSFTPWAFRGGVSPGCSYRQSFLSLQA